MSPLLLASHSSMKSLLHLTDFECSDTQSWRKTSRAHLHVLTHTHALASTASSDSELFRVTRSTHCKSEKILFDKIKLECRRNKRSYFYHSIASTSAWTQNCLMTKTVLLLLLRLHQLQYLITSLVEALRWSTSLPPLRRKVCRKFHLIDYF